MPTMLRTLLLFTAAFGFCFEVKAQQNKDARERASLPESLLSVHGEVPRLHQTIRDDFEPRAPLVSKFTYLVHAEFSIAL